MKYTKPKVQIKRTTLKTLVTYDLPRTLRIAKSSSYYPESQRKPFIRRLCDNLVWLIKYGESNGFYNLYGFDIVGSKFDRYVDYESFFFSRNVMNRIVEPTSQTCLLQDKFLFYKYMKCNHLPTPEVFAVYDDGKIYDGALNEVNEDYIKDRTDYFIKDIGGKNGSSVKHIRNYDEFKKMRASLSGKFILQERLVQSEKMSEINPDSTNTVRVITVNKNGKPYVFSTFFKVGTTKTKDVDNWAVGGLVVGIEEAGYLKEFGFYKPGKGGKMASHPDTHVEFAKFQIPMYQEALALACRAHKYFYGVHSIGWDVAITPNGPMIIEGNDNWEISVCQLFSHGLKKEWEQAVSADAY